ncbi:MAG: ankyrin repeat domain-containing protein [Amoebophilaceae bacterium]|nr:ankyrin repeat domain-containing protein [Amoebophilaceae bacterium]
MKLSSFTLIILLLIGCGRVHKNNMSGNNKNNIPRNHAKQDGLKKVNRLAYEANAFTLAITGLDDVNKVKKILENPLYCNYHLQTFSGLTPVFLATYAGNTKIVKFLIGKGCDFNTASHAEETTWTQNQGTQGTAQSHSSSMNKTTYQFFRRATPLMVATMQGRTEILNFLLEQDNLIMNDLADGAISFAFSHLYG